MPVLSRKQWLSQERAYVAVRRRTGSFAMRVRNDDLLSHIVRFADDCAAVTTMAALDELMRKAIEHVGFRWYSLVRHVDLKEYRDTAIYCENYPSEWTNHFIDHRLYIDCAAVSASKSSLLGVCWKKLRQMGNFSPRELKERQLERKFGLRSGFTFSLRIIGEPDGLFSAARENDTRTSETEKIALRAIATTALDQARRLVADANESCPTLGPRQLECTRLVAQGKTDWEMGQILGVSRDTVHEYVETARKRFGVRTRTQLVVEAIRSGQIVIEELPR